MNYEWGKICCLFSYMMNELNQYYYCYKGKSAWNHVICQQTELYIWQGEIFNNC